MRPTRFQTLLVDVAAGLPGVQRAAALADVGHTAHPLGVALQLATGAQLWWQITAVSTPGDVYGNAEGQPVTGAALAARQMPDLTVVPVRTVAVEQALAAGIAAAGCEEIAAVEPYSEGTTVSAIEYGLTVRFHSGATVFVNGLAHLKAGEDRPRGEFLKLPAEV
ncbi:hypothetical protein OHV05_38215 (plasmid) [Kitasatospora sp. NBC_00070]|uniref:hypothetical protein n=1 Tax=Kitasatospora sp. NBC_00070 TaxID=2975962 RepID=UPI002F90B315